MPQRGVVSMREPQRHHSAKRAVSEWGLVWHRAVSEELWLHALHVKTSGICPSPSVILPLEGLAAPLHTPSDGDLASCKQPESTGLALGTQTSDPSSTQRQSSHPINLTSKLNSPRPCTVVLAGAEGSLGVCPRVGSNQPGTCPEPTCSRTSLCPCATCTSCAPLG